VPLDFVGMDPDSPQEECPAVFVDSATGDFYIQGKTVTDPSHLEQITGHGVIAADETVVWLPHRMEPIIADALRGYEQDRQGPGQPTFAHLLQTSKRSAVHLETRDTYDTSDSAFADWLGGGSGVDDSWGAWKELIGAAVARGVTVRRARIVSEPVTDYIRWEHMLTAQNLEAGEDVRWLPRRRAFDLMLPGADFWMFDQRLVRFNFNAGDGASLRQYEYTTDPRAVAQCVAAFEMVWDRAIPHEEYRLP
jgi:hypothetical protein